MRIIFMGTPDFAVPCLEALIKSRHKVVAVFTQPDKKKGRGYKFAPPPVKELAQRQGIKVFQPETLNSAEVLHVISELEPDLIVVVAYGKILPKAILRLPERGCINVHGSLLPKYRGAAPIQWAVINGEKATGVTTMYMDEGLDTGDILLRGETQIGEDETSGELFDRLSVMGAELLLKTLQGLEKGDIIREKQDDKKASYAPMLNKSLSKINWNNPAAEVHNLVRGLNPWPVAETTLDGKVLKIYKVKPFFGGNKSAHSGEVVSLSPFSVACCKGSTVEVLELQLEAKKRMSSADFVRGYKLSVGAILG